MYSDENFTYFAILISIIALIVGCIIYWIKKKQGYQSILLVGCSNSGKTVLYSYIIYNRIVTTYTSMKENIGLYNNKKKNFLVIDIPGHDRLRQSLIDQYKTNVRGIIFMIDSKTVQTEIRDVAELLYSLLTDSIVRSSCKDMLIVCNKQDLPEAKGIAVIQLLLEKELNLLRGLKTKQLDSTSSVSDGKKKIFLGTRKKEFEFAQLKPMNISFIEAIITVEKDTEANVDGVTNWLQKC